MTEDTEEDIMVCDHCGEEECECENEVSEEEIQCDHEWTLRQRVQPAEGGMATRFDADGVPYFEITVPVLGVYECDHCDGEKSEKLDETTYVNKFEDENASNEKDDVKEMIRSALEEVNRRNPDRGV